MNEPRVTVVTGASKGIGRGVADYLAGQGHKVINLSRSKPQSDFPGVTYQVDLADEAAAAETLSQVSRDHRVDNLVCNAGIIRVSGLDAINLSEFREVLEVNLRAVVQCAQAFLPPMRDRGRGRIVNIGSRAALGKEGRTSYAASKAGVLGVTRTWALELAEAGITVNAVAPGPIATELFLNSNPPDHPRTKALIDSVPVKRVGTPADVAAAVAFFLGDEASFITGQVLYVCGGLSVGSAQI